MCVIPIKTPGFAAVHGLSCPGKTVLCPGMAVPAHPTPCPAWWALATAADGNGGPEVAVWLADALTGDNFWGSPWRPMAT